MAVLIGRAVSFTPTWFSDAEGRVYCALHAKELNITTKRSREQLLTTPRWQDGEEHLVCTKCDRRGPFRIGRGFRGWEISETG